MIQDIYPMKLDNAFQMKEPDADSRILAFRDRTVYLKNEGEITFLKYHVWVEYCKTHHKKVPGLVYLFSVDDISFYLTELYEDVEIPGFMYHKLFASAHETEGACICRNNGMASVCVVPG